MSVRITFMSERVRVAQADRKRAFPHSERQIREIMPRDAEAGWVYRNSPLHLRFRPLSAQRRYRTAESIVGHNSAVRRNSLVDRLFLVSPFELSFCPVLPEGESRLKNYIEHTLVDKKGHAVGLELGGVGSKVFSQFTSGFFEKTCGVSLNDFRDKINPKLKGKDAKRNHTVITGNILDEATQACVKDEWLHGEKIDIIFHRMAGGNGTVPKDPFFVSEQASIWYQLLAEGGLIFSQVPYAFTSYIEEWADHIKDNYKGKLELQVEDNFINDYVLRLRKLNGAPKKLPLLRAWDVMGIRLE